MLKPPYLHIDSKDRMATSSSTHNFIIQLMPSLEPIKNHYLKAVSLPLGNYNINSTNNLIYFNGFIATMTPGIYDYTSILAEIKSSMEATAYAGTITAIYDNETDKFTITGTIAYSFEWSNTTNSAAYILGFPNSDTISALSQTSVNIPNLSLPPCFAINIDEFPKNVRTSSGLLVNFIVYITVVSGEINFHFDQTHFKYVGSGTKAAMNQLHISLINPQDGSEFNINGLDWQFLMYIEYY